MLIDANTMLTVKAYDVENDEYQSQQRVKIIWNGADEQINACNAGAEIIGDTGDSSCPGRERGNHADGSCRSINQEGQLGTGYFMPVGNRTHDRAYGQTVEVVINENNTTQQHG